jgi:DNA-directed RNA polymerase specialized sigma24 family protein
VERRLKDYARNYARTERELTRALEDLREERDEAIRQAYRDGLPLQDVAAIMGLSHQYVSRIVRGV